MVVIEQTELNKCHKGEPFVAGVLKTRKPKVPLWFQDFLDNRFSKVEKRLDNIVKLNNLKE
jgi:hypothetical protein